MLYLWSLQNSIPPVINVFLKDLSNLLLVPQRKKDEHCSISYFKFLFYLELRKYFKSWWHCPLGRWVLIRTEDIILEIIFEEYTCIKYILGVLFLLNNSDYLFICLYLGSKNNSFSRLVLFRTEYIIFEDYICFK